MEQDGILNKMYAFAKYARAKGKHSLLPLQNGIMVSVNSLKSLYADLKEKYGLRYLTSDLSIKSGRAEKFLFICSFNGKDI
jgi:hypothetical protein